MATFMGGFFMIYRVVDRTYVPEGPTKVSLEARAVKKQPEYKAEKVELSDNIRKFDSKPRTVNKEEVEVLSQRLGTTMTATEMIYDATYNKAGKLLGVDSIADWSKNYDKVYRIVETAKEKLGTDDVDKILPWLYKMMNASPSITNRKIDDLNTFLSLSSEEKKEHKKPKTIVKTVVKYVRSKPKYTIGGFVKSLLNTNVS
jgi:hypothetical protein